MKMIALQLTRVAFALGWAAFGCIPGPDDVFTDASADSVDASTSEGIGASTEAPVLNDPGGGQNREVMPAFTIPDVNPASPRSGQVVSPRDYLGQISAWYFGHST